MYAALSQTINAAPCAYICTSLLPPQVTARALFEPPPFQPSKLEVSWSGGAGPGDPAPSPPHQPRRYTLTHNDITGSLWLTVGRNYNTKQISGFYTRLLRDEVTAEWRSNSEPGGGASLHVFCHVSGQERWLAPPVLRNYIFRREMPLVRAAAEIGTTW